MWTKWTSHLRTDEERTAFKRQINGSQEVLDRVRMILEERYKGLEDNELDPKIFGSPSWPYLQAAICGRKAELRDTIKLLTLTGEDNGLTQ